MSSTMSTYQAEKILGLGDTYTRKQVRTAYRKLAMEYHPDHASNNGIDEDEAKARMQEVNAAYERLEEYFTTHNVDFVAAAAKKQNAAEDSGTRTAEAEAYYQAKKKADDATSRARAARDAAKTAEPMTEEEIRWHIDFHERARKQEEERKKQVEKAAEAAAEKKAEETKQPTRRMVDWHSVLVTIVAFFPYRLAFFFGAVFLQKALTGIDLFMGPQGLVPNPDMNLIVWLVCFILLMVSILNLFVPFVTVHIQSKLLDLVER